MEYFKQHRESIGSYTCKSSLGEQQIQFIQSSCLFVLWLCSFPWLGGRGQEWFLRPTTLHNNQKKKRQIQHFKENILKSTLIGVLGYMFTFSLWPGRRNVHIGLSEPRPCNWKWSLIFPSCMGRVLVCALGFHVLLEMGKGEWILSRQPVVTVECDLDIHLSWRTFRLSRLCEYMKGKNMLCCG